jgi:hypothetical protein
VSECKPCRVFSTEFSAVQFVKLARRLFKKHRMGPHLDYLVLKAWSGVSEGSALDVMAALDKCNVPYEVEYVSAAARKEEEA